MTRLGVLMSIFTLADGSQTCEPVGFIDEPKKSLSDLPEHSVGCLTRLDLAACQQFSNPSKLVI